MRLLAIRRSALGDILHLLPVLKAAKEFLPDLSITLLVKEPYRQFFKPVPFLDALWTNVEESVDIAVDFQGLIKSAVTLLRTSSLIKAGYGFGSARERAAALLYNRRIAVREGHIIERHTRLLSEVLGVTLTVDPDYRADFLCGKSTMPSTLPPEPRCLIYPTTSSPAKNLQAADWSESVRRVASRGFHPFFSCGPGEEGFLAPWRTLFPDLPVVEPLPLQGLASLIASCDLFIGGDTGPTHLADHLGIPTLSRFTKWPPERNGPYFSPSLVFYRRPPESKEVETWLSRHFS